MYVGLLNGFNPQPAAWFLGYKRRDMTEIRGLLARILEFSDRCCYMEIIRPLIRYGM
jgi:hypothetical protein